MGRLKVRCPVGVSAERFPERLALEFEARRWSWADVAREVDGWSTWLEGQGVDANDRVATVTWNRPEVLFLWFALLRRGATLVPLNARLTQRELEPLIVRANSRLVITDFPAVSRGAVRDAEFDDRLEAANLFTSGTTGTPSLVPLTVANFHASHRANAENLGASEHQVWLGTLPLFHVGGLAMAFRWAAMGARLVLERQFDAARVAALLRRGDLTHASFVPTALARVLDQPGAQFSSSLEALLIGGGPMGVELLRRARALRLPVLQTYGLTEACSQVTTERLTEADGTTAGAPLPGLEVRIENEDGPVATGTIGEICVRGPTVTPSAGDWLRTKDLGHLDSRGRLTVHARRVDLIVSGGENVYPAEVEAALSESPLVLDVAVGPMPDETWGQVAVAFVVWRSAPDIASLEAHARGRLAGFKVPRRWVTVESLPRNASGKLLRHHLPAPPFPAVTRS
ncbi:MAG: AMP-binding protein [Myxococcaceae bacterium]